MRLHNWLVFTSPLLLLIAACGGGSGGGSSGSSGGGGSSSGSGGSGGTTATTTTTTSAVGGPAACTAASLCPDVHYTDPCTISGASSGSGTGGATGEYTADDVAAAECLLTKMRAHEVGTAKIVHGVGQLGCQMDGFYEEHHLVGLGDGNVSIQSRVTSMIGSNYVNLPEVRALKPNAFFDDCLAATDPGDKVRCVLEMTSAVAPGQACPTFWP